MSTTIDGTAGVIFPDATTQSKAVSQDSPFTVTGNSTAGAEIRLPEDTDNGSNYVALKAADNLAANLTFTLPSTDGTSGQVLQTNGSGTLSFALVSSLATPTTDSLGKIRAVPQSGSAKTTSYTLATTDVGAFINIGSGGSIVIPNSTFTAGDVISLYNDTSGNITVTCSTSTAYIAGTNSNKSSVTLATRGVANVLFTSATSCVITGNVS